MTDDRNADSRKTMNFVADSDIPLICGIPNMNSDLSVAITELASFIIVPGKASLGRRVKLNDLRRDF
jgi:hypothetical protein